MAAIASKITWIVWLLEEFGITNLKPVTLECDNKSALQMAIDFHFTREKVLEGLIELWYVPTIEQLADALIKIVPSHQLK